MAGLQITGYFASFIDNGSFIKVSTDKDFSFENTDFNGVVQNIIPYLVWVSDVYVYQSLISKMSVQKKVNK